MVLSLWWNLQQVIINNCLWFWTDDDNSAVELRSLQSAQMQCWWMVLYPQHPACTVRAWLFTKGSSMLCSYHISCVSQIMAKGNPCKRVRLCTENWGLSDNSLHQRELPFSTLSKTLILTQKRLGQLIIPWTFQQHVGEWLWAGAQWYHASRNLCSPLTTVSGAKLAEKQDIRAPTEYRLLRRWIQGGFIHLVLLFLKNLYRIIPDYFLLKFCSFLQLCSFIWGYHTTGKSCCLKHRTD